MSISFDNALKNTLSNEISITENGAVGFKTTGTKLVDINFAVSSLRSMSDAGIIEMFSNAFYENPLLAVKWLFMLRDVRGSGMGERRSFRVCMKWLATVRPEIVSAIVPLIAEYGRWDDLFSLIDIQPSIDSAIYNVIDEQLTSDVDNMKLGKPVSLLAKWMPSINTSSAKSCTLAKTFANVLELEPKKYRKMLSELRAYLKVIETKMSANKWSEIDYNAVPSKANLKYKNTFLKHDKERRSEWLSKLVRGDADVKINSSANFPCDIVSNYTKDIGYYHATVAVDPALEAMWKALPDFVQNVDTGSTIVVADGSGSMTTTIGNGRMTALDVANSLAIYFAEKLEGEFKNKYITFSERPQYVDFSKAKTLAEKISIALQYDECANTNIEAVFNLLLKTAVDNNLKQSDIPSNVLVVSDMEFDMGTSWNCGRRYYYDADGNEQYNAKRAALFENIKQRWEAAGYKLPRLVFWNVNSRTGTIPLTQNDMGVALVSGFSPAIAKMVFSAKLDPYEVLVDALNVPRYQPVEDAVKAVA